MSGRIVAFAVLVWVALGARSVAAHDLRPGVLAFVQQPDGDYSMRFVGPVDSRGDVVELRVELPAGCAVTSRRAVEANVQYVHCANGLAGELAIAGMADGAMKVIVTALADGEYAEWILTARSPRVRISVDDAPPRAAAPWIWIGIEHILLGPDHLAFVIGLLLVLQLAIDRRLLLAITAFTIAHSITLALAALRVVSVSIPPVEACIAASVLLVAREATHREPTAIRRWPHLAAALFGLIHGLGFAAALGEIGLPRSALAWSLAWFNVGVELGQLAVVGIVVGGVWSWRRFTRERAAGAIGPRVHRALCYVLGGLAGWWTIDRVVALFA